MIFNLLIQVEFLCLKPQKITEDKINKDENRHKEEFKPK